MYTHTLRVCIHDFFFFYYQHGFFILIMIFSFSFYKNLKANFLLYHYFLLVAFPRVWVVWWVLRVQNVRTTPREEDVSIKKRPQTTTRRTCRVTNHYNMYFQYYIQHAYVQCTTHTHTHTLTHSFHIHRRKRVRYYFYAKTRLRICP